MRSSASLPLPLGPDGKHRFRRSTPDISWQRGTEEPPRIIAETRHVNEFPCPSKTCAGTPSTPRPLRRRAACCAGRSPPAPARRLRYRCPLTGSYVLVTDEPTLARLARPPARIRCADCGEQHLIDGRGCDDLRPIAAAAGSSCPGGEPLLTAPGNQPFVRGAFGRCHCFCCACCCCALLLLEASSAALLL